VAVGERRARREVVADALAVGVLAAAERPDEVALRDDAGPGRLGIHDHRGADVVLDHERRRLAQRAPRRDRQDVLRHRFSHLHGTLRQSRRFLVVPAPGGMARPYAIRALCCEPVRVDRRRAASAGRGAAIGSGRIVSVTVHIRPAALPDVPAVLALWARARSAAAVTPDTTEAVERLLATLPGPLLAPAHRPQR